MSAAESKKLHSLWHTVSQTATGIYFPIETPSNHQGREADTSRLVYKK